MRGRRLRQSSGRGSPSSRGRRGVADASRRRLVSQGGSGSGPTTPHRSAPASPSRGIPWGCRSAMRCWWSGGQPPEAGQARDWPARPCPRSPVSCRASAIDRAGAPGIAAARLQRGSRALPRRAGGRPGLPAPIRPAARRRPRAGQWRAPRRAAGCRRRSRSRAAGCPVPAVRGRAPAAVARLACGWRRPSPFPLRDAEKRCMARHVTSSRRRGARNGSMPGRPSDGASRRSRPCPMQQRGSCRAGPPVLAGRASS